MERSPVSALIMAGGASSRMGFNKALAKVRRTDTAGGETLVERIIGLARQLSPDVVIVANDVDAYRPFGIQVVTDVVRLRGPLAGIYSGLLAAQCQHSLVVACDMPFPNLKLWQYMLGLPRDYDVLIPRAGKLLEPLHAIYSKACIDPIMRLVEANDLKIIRLLDQVTVRYVEEQEIDRFDPQHRSFLNVNTPEDLRKANILDDEIVDGPNQ